MLRVLNYLKEIFCHVSTRFITYEYMLRSFLCSCLRAKLNKVLIKKNDGKRILLRVLAWNNFLRRVKDKLLMSRFHHVFKKFRGSCKTSRKEHCDT